MKIYKWIVGLIIILYVYDFYSTYTSENRYKLRTSNEVNTMIREIKETNASTKVLTLWHYYLVRGEYTNYNLMVCFMNEHIKEEYLYASMNKYLDNKGEKLKSKQCPLHPLDLIKDYNTFWDNIVAWVIQIKDPSLHLTAGDGPI